MSKYFRHIWCISVPTGVNTSGIKTIVLFLHFYSIKEVLRVLCSIPVRFSIDCGACLQREVRFAGIVRIVTRRAHLLLGNVSFPL